MDDTAELKHLPLEDLHEAADARFGAFAGWLMPITYPPGVMKEHLYTREHAGLFDISHMGLFEISGPDAEALLALACPLDPTEIEQGQSKYTLLLNDAAGILDDLVVTRLGPERFIVVANAGNAAADEHHLRSLSDHFDCDIKALHRVFLALQGPSAAAAAEAAGVPVAGLQFMRGAEPALDWFITRSGYTGEDGFEIALGEADARSLVGKLLDDARVMWVGLAARDSLRLEAGLCLHGQDISSGIDPLSAGIMWAIPKKVRDGGRFVGAEALRKILATGPAKRRVGLKPDGRQPVRAGAELFNEDGKPAGQVTSGGFGPSVGAPVAMGYVSSDLSEPGTHLFAEIRGSRIPVGVHPLPFVPHRYFKG